MSCVRRKKLEIHPLRLYFVTSNMPLASLIDLTSLVRDLLRTSLGCRTTHVRLTRDVSMIRTTAPTRAAVLSGKGGTGKTLWQLIMAGEASRLGIPTLLVDSDPEQNLSRRLGTSRHATGLGSVLEAAGVVRGEGDAELGATRLDREIVSTPWPGVDLLPAGSSLTGVGQLA